MKKIWQEFHQELEKKPAEPSAPSNDQRGFWQRLRQHKTKVVLGLLLFCLVLFLIWHLRAPQFPL